MVIRKIKIEDATALLDMQKQLDHETKFMLYEPNERTTTPEQQSQKIADILASENEMMFIAESDGQLVGFLAAFGGGVIRNRHRAHLVVGILKQFTGQGIGTRLFTAMEQWAREIGLTRLELTVVTENTAAIALYKKMGFVIEGTKPRTMLVDGAYQDEHMMGKLL